MKTWKKNQLNKILPLVSLLFIILFAVQSNALPLSEIFDTEFDTQIIDKMALGQISTSTIRVINRTEEVFAKGYGEQTNLELVYPLYSINKVLIGIAALQLVEEGLININADINDYLPYIIQNPNYPEISITCKHLLAHRAGITDRVNEAVLGVITNSTIPFPDYIYEFLNVNGSLYDPDFWGYQPGESFSFATLDFEILSYIIEIVTGSDILDYIQSNILDLLEMTKTMDSFSDYSPSEIASPYLWDPNTGTTKLMIPFDTGASLDYKTTTGDTSKLLLDLMNGFSYGNSTLLNSTTITEYMFKHQGAGHGLGLFVDWGDQDLDYKGSLGNGPGYTLFMFFKDEVGVVCFANQGAFAEDFTQDIPLFANIIQYYLYIMEQSLKINEEEICPTCTYTSSSPTDEGNYYFSLFPILLISITKLYVNMKKRR